jgi:hypothetical protein
MEPEGSLPHSQESPHWSLSWAKSVQSTSPHCMSLRISFIQQVPTNCQKLFKDVSTSFQESKYMSICDIFDTRNTCVSLLRHGILVWQSLCLYDKWTLHQALYALKFQKAKSIFSSDYDQWMLQFETLMADANPGTQQLWDWVPASLHA